jgi:hypothetical protein
MQISQTTPENIEFVLENIKKIYVTSLAVVSVSNVILTFFSFVQELKIQERGGRFQAAQVH